MKQSLLLTLAAHFSTLVTGLPAASAANPTPCTRSNDMLANFNELTGLPMPRPAGSIYTPIPEPGLSFLGFFPFTLPSSGSTTKDTALIQVPSQAVRFSVPIITTGVLPQSPSSKVEAFDLSSFQWKAAQDGTGIPTSSKLKISCLRAGLLSAGPNSTAESIFLAGGAGANAPNVQVNLDELVLFRALKECTFTVTALNGVTPVLMLLDNVKYDIFAGPSGGQDCVVVG